MRSAEAIKIEPLSYNSFAVKASGAGVNLNGVTNPVTIVVTIADVSAQLTPPPNSTSGLRLRTSKRGGRG
jgi:hypothetical protein